MNAQEEEADEVWEAVESAVLDATLSDRWDKNGKKCYGFLHDTDFAEYVSRIRPDFANEMMDKVIEFEWKNPSLRTYRHYAPILCVQREYLSQGWKVGHLMMYLGAGKNIKFMLDNRLIHPMYDNNGTTLSGMSKLFRKNHWNWESFEQTYESIYKEVQLMELSERRKILLLFYSGKVEVMGKAQQNPFPKEIATLIAGYLIPTR